MSPNNVSPGIAHDAITCSLNNPIVAFWHFCEKSSVILATGISSKSGHGSPRQRALSILTLRHCSADDAAVTCLAFSHHRFSVNAECCITLSNVCNGGISRSFGNPKRSKPCMANAIGSGKCAASGGLHGFFSFSSIGVLLVIYYQGWYALNLMLKLFSIFATTQSFFSMHLAHFSRFL